MKRIASLLFLTLVALGSTSRSQEPWTELVPGEPFRGELTSEDGPVDSPGLEAGRFSRLRPVRGRTLPIRVPKTGSYTLELRSWAFDPYLVLRNEDGKVIRENDDGPVRFHSRSYFWRMSAGRTYHVSCCALANGTGSFEFELHSGQLEDPDDADVEALELEDLERGIAREKGASLALLLEEFGILHRKKGLLPEARSAFLRTLGLRDEALGPEDPLTARARLRLGRTLTDMRMYRDAVPHLEAASRDLRTAGFSELASEAMRQLGLCLQAIGRHPEARSALDSALESGRFTHAEKLSLLCVVLELDITLGDLGEGIRHAARLRKEIGDRSSPNRDPDHRKLVALCLDLIEASDPEWTGVENRHAASTRLEGIARNFLAWGKLDEARQLASEAVRVLPPQPGADRHLVTGLRTLARIERLRGHAARATPLLLRAMAETTLEASPSVELRADLWIELARTQISDARPEDALATLEKVRDLLETIEEAENPLHAALHNSCARAYLEQGNAFLAEEQSRQALRARGEIYSLRMETSGPRASKDLQAAEGLFCLGSALILQGGSERAAFARDVLHRSFRIRRRALGSRHPDTEESREALDRVGGEKDTIEWTILGIGSMEEGPKRYATDG